METPATDQADTDADAAPETMTGSRDIGLTARTIRLDLGLTLESVCEAVGLSKGHLSRFERGEKTLSAPKIEALAAVLETSVERLRGHDVPDDWITLVRRDERRMSEVQQDGAVRYRYTGLSRLAQSAETYLIELPEGGQPSQTAPQAGHQGVFVISGELELSLGGQKRVLQAGDWIEFPAHLPHTLQSRGGPAQFLLSIASL
ncbi:MAG: helix-turn-helix transcriptional regulator [Devosiaceae bacterium]|nr:helix-turn-helix transcriptional regulator [Devosiaceae bacterium MH13]